MKSLEELINSVKQCKSFQIPIENVLGLDPKVNHSLDALKHISTLLPEYNVDIGYFDEPNSVEVFYFYAKGDDMLPGFKSSVARRGTVSERVVDLIQSDIKTYSNGIIPFSFLLDRVRAITGNTDEAETVMRYIRRNLGKGKKADIGTFRGSDAKVIYIYEGALPENFEKVKPNKFTVEKMVEIAMYMISHKVKPYDTVLDEKITRSNLDSLEKVRDVIISNIDKLDFVAATNNLNSDQIDNLIIVLLKIKESKVVTEMVRTLKEKGFTDEQIAKLNK
jgi:hypothetical protein